MLTMSDALDNIDPVNHTEYFMTSQYISDKGNPVVESDELPVFVSYTDILNDLKADLTRHGYALRTPGELMGYTVYRTCQVEEDGIEFPNNFEFYKPISLNDNTAIVAFQNIVRHCIENRMAVAEKPYRQKAMKVLSGFVDQIRDSRHTVFNVVASQPYSDAPVGTLNGNSGLTGVYRVVPPKSWFCDKLQSIDPRSLLGLFPDAEAQALMLGIGRVLAGVSGREHIEGIIEHTFRSFYLVVGTEAGLGKSTLFNHIITALEFLGYKTTTLNSRFGTFGWEDVAMADLSYMDDLTKHTQKEYFNHPMTKSIASSGMVKTEKKGKDAITVKATSVMFACSNHSDPLDLVDLDPGHVSRLNQLYTYTSAELTAISPEVDLRTRPHWEYLSELTGASTLTLGMYLLRGCLDIFLDVCGYQLTDYQLTKVDGNDLEAVTKALREQYIIPTEVNHASHLLTGLSEFIALSIAKASPEEQEDLIENVNSLVLTSTLLLAYLDFWVDNEKEGQHLHPKGLSSNCRPFLRKKRDDLARLDGSKSLKDSWAVIMRELVSSDSIGYPQNLTFYQARFNPIRRNMKHLVADMAKTKIEKDWIPYLENIRVSLR